MDKKSLKINQNNISFSNIFISVQGGKTVFYALYACTTQHFSNEIFFFHSTSTVFYQNFITWEIYTILWAKRDVKYSKKYIWITIFKNMRRIRFKSIYEWNEIVWIVFLLNTTIILFLLCVFISFLDEPQLYTELEEVCKPNTYDEIVSYAN